MNLFKITGKFLAVIVIASTISACSDSDNNDTDPTGNIGEPLSLNILHINDHHSHLQPDSRADLTLAGSNTRVEMGGFPRVVAKMNELAANKTNVLKLHSGDAITGDLYYTLFKGEADAALMNEVCFDAFALGNHEFDGGDQGLKEFLDYLYSPVCQTAVLAANVAPELGTSPLTQISSEDYFKPYVIKEVNGQKVGLIGIDIARKTKNSSNPDSSTEFLDEQETSQKYIDELTAQGVDKIVLMTHYQYKNDKALAKNLSGVDVIVGGDSHTLLGEFDAFSLNSGGAYPTQETDKDGNKVCIVQAWQYSNVVGELNVEFDNTGKVTACAGTPHLLIGDTFKRKDDTGTRVELTGNERQAVLDEIAATNLISIVTPDAQASSTLSRYSGEVETLKQTIIGTAEADLCLERIPGQGKSALCDVSLTASKGSDISNIVSQAYLEQSLEADICIQNGGGVRIDIPAGPISIGDAYTLLPFANTLVNLEMSGEEIITVLEEGLDYALQPDGSTGAYPYTAGLRFNVDASQPKGQRLSNVQVKLKGETSWAAIDPATTYTVVSNSFLAGGRDGYLTFGTVSDDGRAVDTYLDYAQAFVDFVKRKGVISKLPDSDYSTQQFINTEGVQQ